MEAARIETTPGKEGWQAMKYIKASEFKTGFAKLVDGAMIGGEPLVVVKSGKPRVKFGGVKPARKRAYFGMDKGGIKILGDIVSPMWDLWGEDFK